MNFLDEDMVEYGNRIGAEIRHENRIAMTCFIIVVAIICATCAFVSWINTTKELEILRAKQEAKQ